MLIQCTKKLLEQLNISPEQSGEEELLFCWHAHFIMVNRRKTVVLVNDQNRYVIVFHGLKAKDFKRFDEIIVQGIRETFEEEGIKEEIIEKFLLQSEKVTYSKTKDCTSVARLNKACENVFFNGELLDSDQIINTMTSMRVSRYLVGDGKNAYFHPNDLMYRDLEALAGYSIFQIKAVQLKITLQLKAHRVWRRIIVPDNRTFKQLHDIIQVAFGWRDYHHHEFFVYEGGKAKHGLSINHAAFFETGHKPIVNLVCDEEAFAYPSEIEMRLEKGIKISEYIPTHKMLKYNYDFGDNWQHTIEVERMIDDYHVNYPICQDGEGNTPPEDVGGEYGYEEFLIILGNPEHPDHNHMTTWAKMQGYKDFDIEKVNLIFKNK
ncbi:plasmid pRiA4b ORF-3 family protein [Fredinandcohnia quinoae]|uniref:Plasmid pRiA4b ORF-3 family protein n=1 Tax=Fredinandcohnia quinoae TaxID=2918902 RepID=A0AAW5E467_9BACI|nr:plasmid pRiA4b ORF-3 family protein [Fredinandcohnia sp. SECRCQ15]MCH1627735.1 plasmid pRiA4b ORF-3 family protein [Fredinandcohnia sp. SECRCQ15]